MELGLFLLYPERRNQLGVNLTGSEGRAPEFTALMVSRFYTLFVSNSNTVTFCNSGNNLAGVLSATDRNSRGDASQGLKMAKLNAAALARKYLKGVNSGNGAKGQTRRSLKTRTDKGGIQRQAQTSGRAPSLALA